MLYSRQMRVFLMIPGFATPEGTQEYRRRFPTSIPSGHYQRVGELWASPIGLGSYLGENDDRDDQRLAEATQAALSRGCNVLDSAINYRCQRSERVFGRVLKAQIDAGEIRRDEVIVATKAGFLPFDGTVPANPGRYWTETYIRTELIDPQELVAGCQCFSVRYLADQLQRSRRNLGLETIDIYYLHNPEMQLEQVTADEFERRIKAAFTWLEDAVRQGWIRCYGTATWNGYRVDPDQPGHLSLERLVQWARQVGGPDHHFRVIQLPHNLRMPEAMKSKTQSLGGRRVSIMEAAAESGISVMTSASICQGQAAQGLPSRVRMALGDWNSDAQRALQFTRSSPGVAVALVGMKNIEHVHENLAVASRPPLSESEWVSLGI